VNLPDAAPGIRRLRSGSGGGFRYVDAEGNAVRDSATLARTKSLANPPAWRDVWITPEPRGHVQARGRDGRDRKQYRYRPL
jgi:DNA topoisomerase-1